MRKVVAISQARMTSTRLPGKVLLKVAGKTLLEHHVERVRRAELVDEMVVATTTNSSDDSIVALCAEIGVKIFRGSEEDVLSRYFGAAQAADANIIVRVTSDCPLIDWRVIDKVVAGFCDGLPSLDYMCNRMPATYPRGLDTEVFSMAALRTAHENAKKPTEHEHVTPYIWTQPDLFQLGNISYRSDQSSHRWTVDTPEDFDLISRMLEALYPSIPDFSLEDCLAIIDAHPDWKFLNQHVIQKDVDL